MSHLSERPDDAVVGLALPHESAALHVTGRALYTDDLEYKQTYLRLGRRHRGWRCWQPFGRSGWRWVPWWTFQSCPRQRRLNA